MGLGPYQQVSLAQARKRAKAARDKLADGIDPIDEKRSQRRAAAVEVVLPRTFEAYASDYIATHSPSWRNEIRAPSLASSSTAAHRSPERNGFVPKVALINQSDSVKRN